jgi:hypothetical protein
MCFLAGFRVFDTPCTPVFGLLAGIASGVRLAVPLQDAPHTSAA